MSVRHAILVAAVAVFAATPPPQPNRDEAEEAPAQEAPQPQAPGHDPPVERPSASPLKDVPMHQDINPRAPAMTQLEFEQGRHIYFERCAGCHGVLRQGAKGKPLTPDATIERGTEYLKSFIERGSDRGMPTWVSELYEDQLEMMARYIQQTPPQPPEFGLAQMQATWKVSVAPELRPAKKENAFDLDNLFVAILADAGAVALIDGDAKAIVGIVKTGYGVQTARVSASGRYVYVLGRDGRLDLIDLWMAEPRVVAEIRVGLEARTLEASKFRGYEDRFAIAGAYWPPQYAILKGDTLEPLRIVATRGMTADTQEYHPEPRVAAIVASHLKPQFVVSVKDTGKMLLVDYRDVANLTVTEVPAVRSLQDGGWDSTHRYALVAADEAGKVAVLDAREGRLASVVEVDPLPHPRTGANFVHPECGPVWATGHIASAKISLIATDPARHKGRAWTLCDTLTGPGTGNPLLRAHPKSRHLYADAALGKDRKARGAIAVFDIGNLKAGYALLPLAEWAEIGGASSPISIARPEFNKAGDEVWIAVRNAQSRVSAIVVVDDRTLKPKAVIKDVRLVTPSRQMNVYNAVRDLY